MSRRAQRDMRRLDRTLQQRIVRAGNGLLERPMRGDVKALKGRDEYRLRVGDWRVRFRVHPSRRVVEIIRVLPRGRAYRD